MGLAEQLAVGAKFERQSSFFTSAPNGSGSISLAPSYIILSVQSDNPVRLRLYDNLQSLNNVGELNRTFSNTAVSNSIALITDISMSAGTYTMDPVPYAVIETASSKLTYYRTENSTAVNLIINYYPIESADIVPLVGTKYVIANRRTLPSITETLGASGSVTQVDSGSIVGSTIPTTYLLVSASLTNASHLARLRLYSTIDPLYDTGELNRIFSVEPSASTSLICDALISGSQTLYFNPKIIGSNIDNIQDNLIDMRTDRTLITGKNELYYVIHNLSNSSATITANIHVYSLED